MPKSNVTRSFKLSLSPALSAIVIVGVSAFALILVPFETIVVKADVQRQAGSVLSPAAEPGASYEFRIERIYPVAEAAGQRNAFRVRARFDGPVSDRLKPCMEGAARIRVGTAPLGWLMVRDMVEAVRRWLWV